MARFSEGLTDESAIRKKYRLTESDWEKLGSDDSLVRAITDEKTRRIRDRSHMREKSQLLVTRAPDVLGKIMDDDSQSARHRIDSCKVLNDFASNGPENNAPDATRFVISINLTGNSDTPHILNFNKSIKPDATDSDPFHPDDTPQEEWLPVITTSKSEDGGNGESL
jgi:hypothetical protein